MNALSVHKATMEEKRSEAGTCDITQNRRKENLGGNEI